LNPRTVGNPFLKLANDFIKTSQQAKNYLDLIQPILTTYDNLNIEAGKDMETVKNTLNNFQKLDLDFVKSFLPDKSILEKLPSHFINTILSYAIGNMRVNRKVQDSDTGDLMHACYLPFCDIWRGDISFCNILIAQKVDGYEKTVNRLSLLPTVIENKLTLI